MVLAERKNVKFKDIKDEWSYRRRKAEREARERYRFVQSRGIELIVMEGKKGDMGRVDNMTSYPARLTLKDIQDLVDTAKAYQKEKGCECVEACLVGGYDGADYFMGFSDMDYDPWVSEYDLDVWRSDEGWLVPICEVY